MKKLLVPLVAAGALAAPASALAWGGGHDHHGDFHSGFAGITKLSGTGTSFGSNTATASGMGFSASLSTTWSAATSKTFTDNDGDNDDSTNSRTVSCAPATASVTLGTAAAVSYTGRTCSWTHNSTTKYIFAGKASDGSRVFLGEKGTTVMGAAFKGSMSFRVAASMRLSFGLHMGVFAGFRSHH